MSHRAGKQALDIAHKPLPDLILPEMDGFETCQRPKANPATKDVPMILLTGQGRN